MANELIIKNGIIVDGSMESTTLSATSITMANETLDTEWTLYSPSWSAQTTSPSLGDGSLTGAYKQIGKTVFVRVRLVWGSTTSGGTGAWLFSLPLEAKDSNGIQMPCSILDNGNAWYQGIVNGTYAGLTTESSIICPSSGGSHSSVGVDANNPFTWGSNDTLQFSGCYEAL